MYEAVTKEVQIVIQIKILGLKNSLDENAGLAVNLETIQGKILK